MKISLAPSRPFQSAFTEEDIARMQVGRRQLNVEWKDVLKEPFRPGQDWHLLLPFRNSYENAFKTMCRAATVPVPVNGGRLAIYLKAVDPESGPPQEVYDWIETVGKYVAMRDFLALSFALDYDREGGNPKQPQTKIGRLRSEAKPYGDTHATSAHVAAADQLVLEMLAFLREMRCYRSADCVVAMPPSDPAKTYNLPRRLAEGIAKVSGREDLSGAVTTIKARSGLKNTPKAEKLATLRGTIAVDAQAFQGKNVLLVDDLYQSGISINYCALLLLQAGAEKVFGLCCEKTCSNDDNLGVR
jgi:hypothetical protein